MRGVMRKDAGRVGVCLLIGVLAACKPQESRLREQLEFPSERGAPSADQGVAELRAKLDFAGIKYEFRKDPFDHEWIIWSQEDNEAVRSIRSVLYSGDTASKLAVLEELGDTPRFVNLLEDAAQAGDAEAQYRLGLELILGEKLPQDYSLALQWLRASAVNRADSFLTIGVMYENGWGVEQDFSEALRLLSLVANQEGASNRAEAFCKIGWYHELGLSVPKDSRIASQYFQRAEEIGRPCERDGFAPGFPKRVEQ